MMRTTTRSLFEKVVGGVRAVSQRIAVESPVRGGEDNRGMIQHKVIAGVIALAVVGGLVIAGGASSAVVATSLMGDEEVERDDTVNLGVTVEAEADEDVPKDGFLLTLTDETALQVMSPQFPFHRMAAVLLPPRVKIR